MLIGVLTAVVPEALPVVVPVMVLVVASLFIVVLMPAFVMMLVFVGVPALGRKLELAEIPAFPTIVAIGVPSSLVVPSSTILSPV